MSDQQDEYEEEFDLEACEAEGTEVATHSVDTDGMGGSCSHSVWLWRGAYWCWSTDFDPCGPFDSLRAALADSEFFLLNEGVWHELSSKSIPHEEFVALVRDVQPEDMRPEAPMELKINRRRYVLMPAGSLEPVKAEGR